MKIGQIVFALRADTSRLCKAMAKLNKATCPKRAGDPRYEERAYARFFAMARESDAMPSAQQGENDGRSG